MKKVKILILLVLLVLAGGYFLLFKNKAVEIDLINNQNNLIKVNLTQTNFKNISFKFNESEVSLDKEIDNLLRFYIQKESKILNRNEGYSSSVSKTTPLNFFLNKNQNPENLSISKWFEENTPEQEKQSIYSALEEEEVNIGGVTSYKVRYQAHPQLTGGYYDLVTIYIPYKTDIYQIEYYSAPKGEVDPSLALSEEEKKSIEEYEKIVGEIINSIRFEE